jgi:phospholipid-binding lipoprotein MlaA
MTKKAFRIFCFCLLCLPLVMEAKDQQTSAPGDSSGEFHDPFDKPEKARKPEKTGTVGKPDITVSKSNKKTNKVSDPLEPVNRVFFTINDKLYFWLLKPVETGYKTVVPRPARVCVDRVFLNARFPIRLVNNVLQGKFKSAGIETTRFAINSTFGIGGLFDIAERRDLKEQKADLDQTLAHYKVPTGIYFCWPVVGPASVRGTVGMAGDSMLQPWGYTGLLAVTLGVPAYDMTNSGSLRIGEYEEFKNSTLDPYVAMRSAYFEHRASTTGKKDEFR